LIEERKKEPGDDLISGLLKANIDGEHLEMVELLGFCALLLGAGNETTTNLLGNAMLTFVEYPEVWEQLKANLELLPLTIEEVLRYRSVVAWIGSANHDEDQFPHPEEFDVERSPNRHLAFGQGIHYCLGAPLARLEAKIALETVLDCFQRVELVLNTNLEGMPSNLISGLKRLPIQVYIG